MKSRTVSKCSWFGPGRIQFEYHLGPSGDAPPDEVCRNGLVARSKWIDLPMDRFLTTGAPSKRAKSAAPSTIQLSFDDAVAQGVVIVAHDAVRCKCSMGERRPLNWGQRSNGWPAHQRREEHQNWARAQHGASVLAAQRTVPTAWAFQPPPSRVDEAAAEAAAITQRHEEQQAAERERLVFAASTAASTAEAETEARTTAALLPTVASARAITAALARQEAVTQAAGEKSRALRVDELMREAHTHVRAADATGAQGAARGSQHAARLAEEDAASAAMALQHGELHAARTQEI